MNILDLFRRRNVPRCSVCGQTNKQIVNAKEAMGRVVIGNLVGICPICTKAFCTDHAPYDHSIAVDSTVCPEHKVALDF